MDETLLAVKRPRGWTIFILITSPFFFASGVYVAYNAILSHQFAALTLGVSVSVGIVVGIIGWIRYRLIITGESLEQSSLRTVRIYFSEIESVNMNSGKLTIRSNQKSMQIGKDVDRYKDVLTLIARKTKTVPMIRYTGDEDDLFVYFGKKPE